MRNPFRQNKHTDKAYNELAKRLDLVQRQKDYAQNHLNRGEDIILQLRRDILQLKRGLSRRENDFYEENRLRKISDRKLVEEQKLSKAAAEEVKESIAQHDTLKEQISALEKDRLYLKENLRIYRDAYKRLNERTDVPNCCGGHSPHSHQSRQDCCKEDTEMTTTTNIDDTLHRLATVIPKLKRSKSRHKPCREDGDRTHTFGKMKNGCRVWQYRRTCEGRGYVLLPLDSRGLPSEAAMICLPVLVENAYYGAGGATNPDLSFREISDYVVNNLGSCQEIVLATEQAAVAAGLLEAECAKHTD